MNSRKLLAIFIGILLLISVTTIAEAQLQGTVLWIFENATTQLIHIDNLGNLNTTGYIEALSYNSTVATGTAPFTIASTTQVGNLNVSYAGTAYDVACGGCIADAEVDDDLTISQSGSVDPDALTNDVNDNDLVDYAALQTCSDTEIIKMSGAAWACAADAGGTDTNASTACSGTTTYLDGEGNCDDISEVYVDETGDTMSGSLNMSNTINLYNETAKITAGQSSSYIYIADDGSIVFHAEA